MSLRTAPALLAVFVLAACATSTQVPEAGSPGGAAGPGPAVPPAEAPSRPVSPQQVFSPEEAAGLITSGTSLRHLTALSTDAMMGRDTRRPEIWDAARYIAGEFRAMGLEPMDEGGDFIVEYPITIPEMRVSDVQMLIRSERDRIQLLCGLDFAITPTMNPPDLESLVLTPMLDPEWYRENADMIPEGSMVLAPFPLEPAETMADNLRLASWMANVEEAGAGIVGLVLPPMVPPEVMGTFAEEFSQEPALGDAPLVMMSTTGLNRILSSAGLPGADMYSITSVQELPIRTTLRMPVTPRTITAPNVVAFLPGERRRDLKGVVVTAHFDHERPATANAAGDTIYNGADDNASGTVGLLEVARAFSALQERPARSVVFAAVSGEELGLLGSAHLAETGPAPASFTAANLNMDMLSRNGADSLFVFGQTYSSLGQTFRAVLHDHPDLGFRVRTGLQMPGLDLIRFSDQASYMERGVPALFFNSGFHPELHTPDDEVQLADPDKLSRAARLMFYLAWELANDPDDPVWTEEGRARAEGMAKKLGRRKGN